MHGPYLRLELELRAHYIEKLINISYAPMLFKPITHPYATLLLLNITL